MTFSIVQFILIAAFCASSAALVSQTRTSAFTTEKRRWGCNVKLLFAALVAGFIGCINSGVGLIAMVVVALIFARKNSLGMAAMKERNTPNAILMFIGAPVAVVAAVIGSLTALYTVAAFVFSQFPLPFALPYSLIPSFLGFFVHGVVGVWVIYAITAYLSITAAMVVRNYWSDWRLAMQRPEPAPVSATSSVPTSRSGIDN